jgi:8-amino-7-oxononanoate synthase
VSGLDDWLADASRQRRRAGLRRSLTAREPWLSTAQPLDLAGNDYLGLATDPRVVTAAAEAARTWGAGAGASRLVTGTLRLHERLERRLAEALGHEAALVLSTGYHANLAAVTALADAGTLIVSDAHVHASLVDGCRLARAEVQVVPHLDLAAVAAALSRRGQPRALVLTESVFSVLGDAAPVTELATVCARHDATLLVDEAHAVGVAGRDGLGLVAENGLAGAGVVVTLTLSKSLGSQGGAVLASAAVVEHLVNTARPFIFDTGLAPPAAGAALAALDALLAEPSLAGRVRARANELAAGCGVPATSGAIVPVPMPGPDGAVAAQAAARRQDVLVGCFRPPSVPDGVSRLRLTSRATLTGAQMARALRVLSGVLGADGAEP